MKPRPVILEIESITDIDLAVLRNKRAYWIRVEDSGAHLKTLAVKEIRVNVVKPEKGAVK
jgi:hypothetical protein